MHQQMMNGNTGGMAPGRVASVSIDVEEGQGERSHTQYKSQTTLTNASTLKEDLRNRMRLSSSNVLKDIAREGVAGAFPR